ncbi:uncharacterized protein LOC117344125 [Pecten maximus]|uniref:uncharacterized protein LOC117344125 n=1 Tax=Pecten maximus TaxID=6579 RepID=UPI0014584B57|nr:uncharacterized protein LOC117344125 [Pecten maximus]
MGKTQKRPGQARQPGKRPRRAPARFAEENGTEANSEPHVLEEPRNEMANIVDMPTGSSGNTSRCGGSADELPVEWVTGPDCVSGPVPVVSVFDAIGDHVPLKLREKIWAGEFIGLGVLLKSARDLTREMDQAGGEIVMKGGKLVVQKHLESRPIYNINVWTSAFMVFTSILLEKQPGKAQELLKYMRDIRLAANRSGSSWVRYDEQYRIKKVRYPGSSWGVIDSELWLLYVTSQRANALAGQPRAGNDSNMSPGRTTHAGNISGGHEGDKKQTDNFRAHGAECWGYNKGQCAFGPRCRYRHACSACGGQHPQTQCRQKPRGNASS